MTRRALLAAALAALALSTGAAEDKDNPLSEPKKSLEHQLKLLKEGNVEKLKECFTKRQQERITKEAVAAGQKQAEKLKLDDVIKDVVVTEQGGTKAAKVTMKNGRTLTTLVLTDGKWLSDTVWFR